MSKSTPSFVPSILVFFSLYCYCRCCSLSVTPLRSPTPLVPCTSTPKSPAHLAITQTEANKARAVVNEYAVIIVTNVIIINNALNAHHHIINIIDIINIIYLHAHSFLPQSTTCTPWPRRGRYTEKIDRGIIIISIIVSITMISYLLLV